MKGVLKLGSVAGIKIEVHWTFTLLLLWVALIEFQQGADIGRIILNEALILILFVCVILHELGHALTAKRFNINTQKIMLLPIGGVATLEKMPEKPSQELLVAFAGPAVNVVIAILLAIAIPLRSYFNFDAVVLEEILYEPTFQNFLFYLFVANVMLVVFNLIPAFPMDGGRVLRALLSFKLGRVEATQIASGIGQGLAMLFFVLGLFFNSFLILIALFIFMGAYGENQMVQQQSILAGHTVKDAMMYYITRLHPEDTIQKAIDTLLAGSEKDFVVTDDNAIVGILYQKDILKNAAKLTQLIRDVMHTDFKTIEMTTAVVNVLELIGTEKTNFFPVTKNGELVGAIDMNNISEFILLKTAKK
jgi:Zn-dependent protease